MTSASNFFDVFLFVLSILVTGPSFMSISSLVLELWQFSFIRDWPEIWKLEIPLSKFCPISGDWGELWVPNLTRMSLIKFYWTLQNARVTAFTVFELLRENQQEEGRGGYPPPHTQIRVNNRSQDSGKTTKISNRPLRENKNKNEKMINKNNDEKKQQSI